MDEIPELERAAEVEDEPFAPGVGLMEEIDADEEVKAPGSSDVSQAWQDNNIENVMSNYGLVQALQDLNMEALTEQAVNDIMRRYEEQNGSYGLTEPEFYEVIEELKGEGIGGGRKRRGRKTKKGGKKSRKGKKSKKMRKTKKRKGKKTRKSRKGKK